MAGLKRNRLAEQADRHHLYQESVQDTESEIDFVAETWASLRKRPAELLREDFCGTANTSCEWVRRDPQHYAVGVDLDSEVLQWGRLNTLAQLEPEQRARIRLLNENVLDVSTDRADIVLAMNFSYYLFMQREELLDYFRCVRDGLEEDGILFLDAYGGYDAPREIVEERECEGFTYVWEQASFNPIDAAMTCHIHFQFPDGSEMKEAFTYHWRLWTLPEIQELLLEAGFSDVVVYWEGTDRKTNEGDGVYRPSEIGDADPGWVCYVVAQR